MKRRIGIIADDSMRGRDAKPWAGRRHTTSPPSSARSASKPGGDGGTFIQRYPIPGGSPSRKPGTRARTAPNVVGILEGSDPVLKNEYVVLSAHMDHVGIGAPVNGDSIYNGADDDASGTAGVIGLAEGVEHSRRAAEAVGALPHRERRRARVVGERLVQRALARADRADRRGSQHRHDRA